MQAGRLKHRIRIERATVTQDTDGGELRAWALLETRWAEKKTGRGQESGTSGRIVANAQTAFHLRFPCGIKEHDRIVHAGINYNVSHVEHRNDLRREIVATVEQASHDGR